MIENWKQAWASLREPLTQIPLVGDAGPWIFLVLMSLLAEFLTDRFVVPALAMRGKTKLAAALTAQADGLRAGVLVAAFSGLTTMEKEAAIIGLIVGAALPLAKLGRDQLMANVMLLGLLLGGCVTERRLCRADADAAYQEVVERCDDPDGIEATKDGYTDDDCPWLPAADRRLERDYKRCP